MHDLVIRGATVIDGTGRDPRRADVAVKDERIVAIGEVGKDAREVVDAGGLTLMPGIIDLHTHFDAQITWDSTLSPSPALGVTTAVMGNCGFGVAPCPPSMRDKMIRDLSVVEGMDLEALRVGINWNFETFGEYLDAIRQRGAYANVAMLVGHSTVRTAVMGEDASVRSQPTAEELARMKAIVTDAMSAGAIGFAGSYSLNHSGYGGIPMPSTIADLSEFEALVGAMGAPWKGVVELAAGIKTVDEIEAISARHQKRIFMAGALSQHDEEHPEQGISMFNAAAAARARGHAIYFQIPCSPVCFDFTLANAYPFYSHDAFAPIKAYTPDQLKPVFRDRSFRAKFRENLRNPKPGTVFQGNWDRITVAVPARPENARLMNRDIKSIAAERGRDPLDVALDLSLDEDLQTAFLGKFKNVVDEGVLPLLKHDAGVIALSDAGAHLIYLCDAGFGLHFLSHWVRERGDFSLADGVRRLTSHPADCYGILDRGRIALGAFADLMLFDPATVGVSEARRIRDLPGGGPRTLRDPVGVHGVFCNGVKVFDGNDYCSLDKAPGHLLDRFSRTPFPAAAIAAE
jgi:N-acyl-D-amino-acid deacylase